MISAGMLAAILMNSFVFPRHARVSTLLPSFVELRLSPAQVFFLTDTSRTLGLLTDLYLALGQYVSCCVQFVWTFTEEARQQ